jgi:hypothetical protein
VVKRQQHHQQVPNPEMSVNDRGYAVDDLTLTHVKMPNYMLNSQSIAIVLTRRKPL